jgi:hypothetical protein
VIEDIVRNLEPDLIAAIAVSAMLGMGAASAADLPARISTKAPVAVPDLRSQQPFSLRVWGAPVGGISTPCHTPTTMVGYVGGGIETLLWKNWLLRGATDAGLLGPALAHDPQALSI